MFIIRISKLNLFNKSLDDIPKDFICSQNNIFSISRICPTQDMKKNINPDLILKKYDHNKSSIKSNIRPNIQKKDKKKEPELDFLIASKTNKNNQDSKSDSKYNLKKTNTKIKPDRFIIILALIMLTYNN